MGIISASLFYAGESLSPLVPEPRELANAWWVPVAHLTDPGNATSIDWAGRRAPGIAFAGQVIWGLTYRILNQMVDRLDAVRS